jgi:hypothetical protein
MRFGIGRRPAERRIQRLFGSGRLGAFRLRLGGLPVQFCSPVLDVLHIHIDGAVRVVPAQFGQSLVELDSQALETIEGGRIHGQGSGRGQLCRAEVVLEDRVARLELLLPKLVHLQVDVVDRDLILLPRACMVLPEHPQRADRQHNARHRKDAVQALWISPSGFCCRHGQQ